MRGERRNYLQIYDHRHERAGFVRASQVRRLRLDAEEAPELLAVVRFLADTWGNEALGIGVAAAYIQAAPPEVLNSEAGIEALDALGTLADRLARRASPAQLEVAARYGVTFVSNERNGRVHVCYGGEAFRRVLAMRSNARQRARAALALTREECVPELLPLERRRMDEWRADVLDRRRSRQAAAHRHGRRQARPVRLDTLATVRQAGDPGLLGAFQRRQDPSWRRQTLSLR